MISSRTDRYQTPIDDERANMSGHYFPDAVIDSISSATQNTKLKTKAPPVLRYIPLDEAIQHITTALSAFDPSLGEQAAAILNNRTGPDGLLNQGQSLNVREVPNEPLRVQGVRAAGLKEEDTMVHPDEEKAAAIAEYFPEIGNERSYAIIDYEYNGTIDAVITLAHEVGHAIADKRQNAIGNTYQDNPAHMEETQAYFTQAIATNHLSNLAGTDPNLAHAAQVFRHNNRAEQLADFNGAFEQQSKRLHARAPANLISEQLVQHLYGQTPETIRATTNMLMGGEGPLGVNAALSRAGIETPEHLTRALQVPSQKSNVELTNNIGRPAQLLNQTPHT